MSKENVNADEWATISGAFCAAQGAATDAFAALAEFDSKAPSKGGQKAFDEWRDANEEEHTSLEHATIVAALNYIKAHAAEHRYFERLDATPIKKDVHKLSIVSRRTVN
jgi:hypothetical protein